MRGDNIKSTWAHDAGAYACCSYCGRYSDKPEALVETFWPCECGKKAGWSGSFKKPDATARWSDASPSAASHADDLKSNQGETK